ncbi:hypothetical protein BOB33_004177 [Escherichia coli]|nr:hypothetical protein [Escherichia coli]ELF1141408.1 hypothetical protein [Escherichia coli]EME4819182.1 hypothetical protein [Escherichia coli]HDY2127347.1 hypothetical protein [Escherichia coli]
MSKIDYQALREAAEVASVTRQEYPLDIQNQDLCSAISELMSDRTVDLFSLSWMRKTGRSG